MVTSLRHSKNTATKRGMAGSPNGKRGVNDSFRLGFGDFIVPQFDTSVQRASCDFARGSPVPVNAVNLGLVGFDSFERKSALSVVPNTEISIM